LPEGSGGGLLKVENAAPRPDDGSVVGDLERLPYSALEARAVLDAFRGQKIVELTGFAATARRVLALSSEKLAVLHFATHAVSRRGTPGESALFLTEYAETGGRLAQDRLTADDIARSDLRANVVVLSACGTGSGIELRGEGVLWPMDRAPWSLHCGRWRTH